MKILDLGCHDGYIAVWLARKLAEHGIEATVDGCDLFPDAVKRAQERAYKYGVGGEFKVCAAEDAAGHFTPGTYDAVVCFELIEHVTDMHRLLDAAEAMLNDDGTVYVSTPDGTFGAGHNPHHLRVLRAVDVAELLRRRGTLETVRVGDDSVTCAAYKPRERFGEVTIHTGGGWQRWSPLDIARKGLGGSETAAVRLAEQLSLMGYVVTVYGEVSPCVYKDVVFRPGYMFDPLEEREIFISSRVPEFFDRPVNAANKFLWVHDIHCGDRLTEARAEQIDHVMALSAFHAGHLATMYPFLAGKIVRTRNGIELSYFDGEQPAREKRLLYTSSPDRGLDVLLELWPKVRERVPDAIFEFCYSDVYNAVAEQDPTVAEHHRKIQELIKGQEGVRPLGSLSQPELARLMRSSLVWAHPSWVSAIDQPFLETSCIGAMEAQAAGLSIVAAGVGALTETVQIGELIEAGPAGHDALVDGIVRGLTDEKAQADAQEKGPEVAKELGWRGVAEKFIGLTMAPGGVIPRGV